MYDGHDARGRQRRDDLPIKPEPEQILRFEIKRISDDDFEPISILLERQDEKVLNELRWDQGLGILPDGDLVQVDIFQSELLRKSLRDGIFVAELQLDQGVADPLVVLFAKRERFGQRIGGNHFPFDEHLAEFLPFPGHGCFSLRSGLRTHHTLPGGRPPIQ